MKRYLVLIAAAVALGGFVGGSIAAKQPMVASMQPMDSGAVVDGGGAIHVPRDYKTRYQALGTWSIADDGKAGAKQLHVVYASPGASAAWKERGTFPDGTVLVKEVYGASTEQMTTGTASHATDLKGWFVMVRDSQNKRAASNPLWADGWGWAWFDATNPDKTTSTNYRTDCQGCHAPASKTEYVYVAGYPELH